MFQIDLGNVLPRASDTFTEAYFRDRLSSEIQGSLDRYISKYSALGIISPADEMPAVTVMQICHLLPVGFVLSRQILSSNINYSAYLRTIQPS